MNVAKLHCFGMPGYMLDEVPTPGLIVAACDQLKRSALRIGGVEPFTYWAKTDAPDDKWATGVVGFVIYIEWMKADE